MVTAREEWGGMLRELGEALLAVLRAEAAALSADLRRSGRYLAVGLAFLGAAAGALFWSCGLLLFTLVAVVHIWLPLWGAALVVLAVFLLVVALLAALGLARLRRVENPVESLKRRASDHLDWWQNRLLGPREDDAVAIASGDSAGLLQDEGDAAPGDQP